MKELSYFDLHCDTLTRRLDLNDLTKDTLNMRENVISLDNIPKTRNYGQFFAIFMPEKFRGEAAERYFDINVENFYRQMKKYSYNTLPCKNYNEIMDSFKKDKTAAVLTIEGGSAFNGKIENVIKAAKEGVCACTLTWNGENEIASGNMTDEGLKPFGKECIRAMEENNIIVDVSHLNDKSFYGVSDCAKRPFIATHSNARSITSHKRNLKDDQIKEIIARKGLIGLNYCIDFLNEVGAKASPDDLLRHTYHILELGGEDVLCLGSDFDGTEVYKELDTLEKSFDLGNFFTQHGIPSVTAEKIMSGNALNFFKEYFK